MRANDKAKNDGEGVPAKSAGGVTLSFMAHVEKVRHVVPGTCILTLLLEETDGFLYRAGQYVWIRFGTFAARPYSIAGRPAENTLEIHIKDSGAGGASGYALKKLKAGQSVTLSPPEGTSVFPPPHSAHDAEMERVLLVAGGLGIAPLKAIAEEALAAGRQVDLLWGVVREEALYLRDEFEALAAEHKNFSFSAVAGVPVPVVLERDYADLSGFLIYLGGPPAMIEAVLPVLSEKNACAESVFYDRL